MSKRVSRVWATLAAVLAAAAIGATSGYLIGLAFTLNLAQSSLFKYAAEHAIDFERPPNEAHELLAAMNASPYPFCSEEELGYFRKLLLKSHFIKDVGRMRGDQLACSATFNRAELPATKYVPSFPGRDKASVYIQMEALRVSGLTPIVIRKGDSYAAMDPFNRNVMPTAVQFTLSTMNVAPGQSTYLGGSHTSLPNDVLTKNAIGRLGGTMYATHCSARYQGCLTLYVPVYQAVQDQRRQIRLCTIAGSLVGGGFGLLSVLLYRRKKGIEQQLRRSIRKNALRVVYQPLVDLKTGKVTGAEALVRWTDEDQLVIPPDVFIKIAEERGFVNQITKLVVRRVLADFGQYLGDHPEFRINVNVAATDLTDPAFQSMLEDALWGANVAPRALGIEITEGATARHQEAIKAIAHLRHRGHAVYIDDFGTGYSSLAYLKDLAVDGIKIDRAFTRAIGTGSVTVGILPQILSMAEALKLKVVAEGIETKVQCSYYKETVLPITGQGWLFGYPVSAAEFCQRWLGTASESTVETDAKAGPRTRRRKEDNLGQQALGQQAPAKMPALAGQGTS